LSGSVNRYEIIFYFIRAAPILVRERIVVGLENGHGAPRRHHILAQRRNSRRQELVRETHGIEHIPTAAVNNRSRITLNISSSFCQVVTVISSRAG
jgi:hypothetical protein